jgi:hypothetical protein
MARASNGLTAVGIAKAKKPGMLADGHGLYLRVSLTGGKSSIFRYNNKRAGKTHDVGLGLHNTASLADRLAALDLRKRRLDGYDPLAAKREAKVRDQLAYAKMTRFGECAEAHIAAYPNGNEVHRRQATWSDGREPRLWHSLGQWRPHQQRTAGWALEYAFGRFARRCGSATRYAG